VTGPPVDPDAFNAFEAAGWERQVTGYEDFFVPITTRVIGPLLDAAAVTRGSRVLDVATGPGYVAAGAAGRGAAAIGVDVAEGMLALARRLHPQLEFTRGDAEALPFEDGSFDAVVANFLLLHVGRPEQVASELARVLRPGGRVALTVWDLPDRARFIGVLVDAIAAAGATPPADMPVGPPIFRFADDAQFAGLLDGAGLEDVGVETIAFIHREPSADALWRGLMGGTVRVSAQIAGQATDMQLRIREAFDGIVEAHRGDADLELPVSVKLASGCKSG
jgi:SAM-dependent methyltransferase